MKKSHILLLVFIAVTIGIIISLVGNTDTYADFSTARKHPDKDFQIIGKLIHGKPVLVEPKDGKYILTFHMTDRNGEVLPVEYAGEKPQDFEKTEQVVVIGRVRSECFEAGSLLLKCPSKYNNQHLPDSFAERQFKTSGSDRE